MSSLTLAPPTKRPRLDVGDTRETVYHKDETIWLPDGNIVLAVQEDICSTESTINTQLFKCHKGTLSRHSVVFRDLFENARPSSAEQFEDTPLINLWDSATDVKHLLTLLYDPVASPSKRNRKETSAMRLSVLRLATKYQMDRIRTHIVSLLEADWPSTLKQWDANEAILRHQWEDSDVPADPLEDSTVVDSLAPEPACVIRLAYEFDIPSLLPAAFYHATRCCRGDTETGEEFYERYPDPFRRSLVASILTQDELHRITETKDWLHKTTYKLVHDGVLREINEVRCPRYSADVKSNTKCTEPLRAWWFQEINKEFTFDHLFDDPLAALKNVRSRLSVVEGTCYACRSRVEIAIDKAREFIWAGIPYWSSSSEQRRNINPPCLSLFAV